MYLYQYKKFYIFSVSIVRQKQYTGVVGILHIVPLIANKIIGTKSIREHVEEKDDLKYFIPILKHFPRKDYHKRGGYNVF